MDTRSKFNAEKYDQQDEWKCAFRPESNHYQRIGLDSERQYSTQEIDEAYQARVNWWKARKKQRDKGEESNSLIKKVGPYIDDALKYLGQASACLLDAEKKRAYDRILEKSRTGEKEANFRESVGFALAGRRLFGTVRKALLDTARELGIDSARGQQIIREEMDKRGAKEVPEEPEGPVGEFRYSVTNGVAHNPKELAGLLLEHPEEAKEHLEDGVFDRKIEQYDASLAVKCRKILKQASSLDIALVEIIYNLNPSLPYRLLPRADARNPEELAMLIDRDLKHWEAGKRQLFNEQIPTWLRTIGRKSVAEEWFKTAEQYKATERHDEGLEYFLHLLNPAMALPRLEMNPPKLRLPTVPGGERTTITFTVSNADYCIGGHQFVRPRANL